LDKVPEITSKLPHIGTTIFTVMSKMAADFDAINLSQGFPDFPVSSLLTDLVTEAMKQGHNQYSPMQGLPQLREVIGEMLKSSYNWGGDPQEEITITDGATEAIYSCITALINPGDEVIVLEPAYDCYNPTILLCGAKPIPILLNTGDFSVPWEKVEAKITRNTRMIIVNSPHNPTGSLLAEVDLQELDRIASVHNLFVLSDEVYERIIFDDYKHESVLKHRGLQNRAIAVFSFGKTFHATGWKVGYIVASENIMREIRKVHQFVTFSVNTPVQWALAEFLKDSSNYLHLSAFYEEKRDFFLNQIKESRFKVLPCHGSYFQTLSYEGLSDLDDVAMAEWLTREHKLASIPISVFCSKELNFKQKLLRFCFAKNEDTLEKAAEILCKI